MGANEGPLGTAMGFKKVVGRILNINEVFDFFGINRKHCRTKVWIFLVFLLCFGCSQKTKQTDDPVLVKIGNKQITVREFIQRSELTVHVQYPAFSEAEMKRFLLNNLIAEKVLAIEGKSDKEFTQNEIFQATIRGIKEQNMREQLYVKEVYDKVKIDDVEIKRVYPLSGREYDVAYYTIYDDTLADRVRQILNADPKQFQPIFSKYSKGAKVPTKTVTFKDPDPEIVNEALYSQALDTGTVIGPLKIKKNEYLVMKVLNWKYYPTIGAEDAQIKWRDVSEKLKKNKAAEAGHQYLADIMQGKIIKFDSESFEKLSGLFYHLYISNQNQQREILKDFLSQNNELIFENRGIHLDDPFFYVNDQVWTIGDFKKAYMSHPLVYRNHVTEKDPFKREFRNAIIDLVRDYYITQKAYEKGLNNNKEVKRVESMWKDSYIALYHRNREFKVLIARDSLKTDTLSHQSEKYIRSLLKKYDSKIEINMHALKQIKLTKIPLVAMKPNVPYPVITPGFPEYTQDRKIEYGKKMQTSTP